jgi:hypothetical protein
MSDPMKTGRDFLFGNLTLIPASWIVALQSGSAAEKYKDNASEKIETVFL